VVRQTDDDPFRQHTRRRVVDFQPGGLVDDAECLGQRDARRFGVQPAGQVFSDRVELGDAACGVRHDDTVADAAQRGTQQFGLLARGGFSIPVSLPGAAPGFTKADDDKGGDQEQKQPDEVAWLIQAEMPPG
jgi:hypothetical protein